MIIDSSGILHRSFQDWIINEPPHESMVRNTWGIQSKYESSAPFPIHISSWRHSNYPERGKKWPEFHFPRERERERGKNQSSMKKHPLQILLQVSIVKNRFRFGTLTPWMTLWPQGDPLHIGQFSHPLICILWGFSLSLSPSLSLFQRFSGMSK